MNYLLQLGSAAELIKASRVVFKLARCWTCRFDSPFTLDCPLSRCNASGGSGLGGRNAQAGTRNKHVPVSVRSLAARPHRCATTERDFVSPKMTTQRTSDTSQPIPAASVAQRIRIFPLAKSAQHLALAASDPLDEYGWMHSRRWAGTILRRVRRLRRQPSSEAK